VPDSSTPRCRAGTAGAEKGTLTLMVGGDEATLEAARPALEPFAGLIVHVGGPGMGQVVKLCNNLIYAAQMVATAEATALAVKSGVDLAQAPRGAPPFHR
jgi:3-hydroxyisobutyrate dehydrogenase